MENFLLDMLDNNGGRKGTSNGASKDTDKDQQGKAKPFKFNFYPGDGQKFLKWAVLGGMGIGLYQMGMVLSRRNINPSVELVDKPEAMNYDPTIRDAFIHLQTYRELNPWLFSAALKNVDQLLFLTQALMNHQVPPERNDKIIAFCNFRMASIRLNMFQMMVREKLNNDHGLAAHIYVDQIYKQTQKHLLNVLHLCSQFNPHHVLQRAKSEIASVMKAYHENRPYEDPLVKWEKIMEKAEKRQQKKRRKQASDAPSQGSTKVKGSDNMKGSDTARTGHHSRARRAKQPVP